MPDAYRTKLERRIRHRDISGVALLVLIFSLVLSFLFMVLSFDYLLKPKPSVMVEFADQAWRLRESIEDSYRKLESLESMKNLAKEQVTIGANSNVAGLREDVSATSGRLKELTEAVYQNQGKTIDTYLNEKRILLVVASVFIAYLVRLFANLYKYNTRLRSQYHTVLDAIDLSYVQKGGATVFDIERFKKLLPLLSVKDIQIEPVGNLLNQIVKPYNGDPQA